MIEAFTRLDGEILAVENLSPGSRLTTAEAWVEHLEVTAIINCHRTVQSYRVFPYLWSRICNEESTTPLVRNIRWTPSQRLMILLSLMTNHRHQQLSVNEMTS